MRRLRGILVVLVLAAILLGSLAWMVSAAHAEDDTDTRWVRKTIRQQYQSCDWTGYCYRAWRWREIRVPATRVYGYARRDHDERDRGDRCKHLRRMVGQQHLTVDGAKKEASDAWAGAVRFHHGEKYIDLANARELSYTCSRSSIKEGGVTTLGQTFTRCEIEAIPCRPVREREGR